jgi:hypothetical protein
MQIEIRWPSIALILVLNVLFRVIGYLIISGNLSGIKKNYCFGALSHSSASHP